MTFDAAAYAQGKSVLVRAHDVKKTYVRGAEVTHALKGISLEIFRGEYICVMGPSGSGKSTFFNMMGGLDTPTGGRVFMDEVDMAQLNAHELAYLRCRKIGYVFQSYNLNPVMTALDNVTLPMIFAGTHADDARRRGMYLLGRSASASGGNTGRRKCRVVSSSGWPSLAHSPTTPLCCCAMSPLPISISRPVTKSISCSTA
jgi:ABC-type proline/glycine betaine transport system ATPase subunit